MKLADEVKRPGHAGFQPIQGSERQNEMHYVS
jgi:hypothetical protein